MLRKQEIDMSAQILRLIVIVWLMMSPLNVTLADVPKAAGVAANPIELFSPIEMHPPLRPLAAGSPQTITVQVDPSILIANSGATAIITATVYDITGDIVDGAILTGLITPGRGSVGSFPATISGTTTSTWTATTGSTVGAGTIQVITDSVSGSAFITLTAGSPNTVTLLANPATLSVGDTSTLTATVVDQYNNPVDNGTIATFTSSLGTALTPRSTSNGIATSTLTSTLAGTAYITASSGLASGTASVVFNPGAPYSTTVQANPATLSVGGISVLTATVADQFNNPVADGTLVTFTSSLGTVLSPRSTSGGIATSTLTSTLAGTAHITVTRGLASGTASVVFNPGTPYTLTVLPNPTTLTVDGTSTLTATVVDQYNNPVANATSVTFTSSLGTVLSPRSTSGGIATSTITSTLVGTANITATSGLASGTASVVFNPGTPYTLTVQPNPTTLTVGGTSTLTATLVDQYNNRVANGTLVTFTSSLGTVLSPRSTSGGIATSTLTSTLAGTAYITATSGLASGTASVVFNPGAPYTLTVQPNPTTLTVGGTSTLTATLVDQHNNRVANGTLVTFTSSLGTVLSPRSTSSGIATSTITSTLAGTAYITATSGLASGTASVVFNPGAPYTLTIQPPTAVISAGQRITYTAIATDIFGNSISNATASTVFSITPASGGNFAANIVTPTVRNTWIVTGVLGGAVSTATLTVTVAAFNRLAIENAPAGSGSAINAVTLNIYGTLAAYAVAYDTHNNLIGAQDVTWGGTGVVAGNLAPTTGISTTFAPIISGTGTITATSSGITDTTGTITVQAPRLLISKMASPDPLTPGSQLQYTIVYTNVGNATAQNVMVTETYPVSVTFVGASPLPDVGNNVWLRGTVGAGSGGSIAVFLSTPGQMPVGSVLTNTVRVSAAKVASAIYTATTIVNALPNLNASIIDNPDPVRPGDSLAYLIQYRNDGSAPVSNVRITETYPAQVTFISASPPPDIGNNVWLTSTLNGNGDSRTILVTVRVNSPLPDSTILTDRVVVAAREAPPYTTTQQTLVMAPRLQLDALAVPLTPTANSLLTYTLLYTNSGSSYAANTIITDAMPVNTSFVQCLPIGCSVNSGTVTWNLGQLNQQTAGAATLTVLVANNLVNGTVITNTARITSTDQVSATTLLTSTIASAPDVGLSNSDGLTAIAAAQIATYTLSYSNIGTAPAANVVITDRIPDYMTFVGCSACVVIGGGTYAFPIGTVNAMQSGVVSISTRLAPTLPAGLRAITNTAVIATTTSGDQLTNNATQDVDDISTRPVLTITPGYDPATPYPGKIITYTLYYTNTSAMDTIGVVITTTSPAWLANTPRGWMRSDVTDVYPIGNLAAGQSGSVTYVMTLPVTYTADMTAFVMTFMIQDGGPGGLPITQASSTAFIGVPDLSIAQVIVPPAIVPGRPFTATLIISNNGLGRACNPSNCGGFYVDAFIDPATPPPSYPYTSDGYPYAVVPPITAGQTVTVLISNINLTIGQRPRLYFKVDNFNCSPSDHTDPCLPSHSLGGLVPEYNEYNNVIGPIPVMPYKVYLPITMRK
jgi:uncharacterized repeat protein (TIGR01451 family)